MTDTPNPAPPSSSTPPATPPNPAPPPSPPSGQTPNTEGRSWLEQLPETLRGDQNLTKYESLEALATGHLNALKRFGKDPNSLIEVPAKPDDDKGWGDLWGKLGRPETADGYKLELGEGATDADKAFADGFRAVAHKAGLTQGQMGAAIQYLNEATAAAHKAADDAATAAADECKKVLTAAWGDKKAVYEAEIPKLLTDLSEKLNLGEGVIEELNANGLANSPKLLQLLAAVTDMRAEPGKLPGAGEGGQTVPATPHQAIAALAALNADPVKHKALMDKNDPLHKQVMAEREALLKQAYPSAQ